MFRKNLSTRVMRVGGEYKDDGYIAKNKNRDRVVWWKARFIRYSEDEPIGPFQPRPACPSFSVERVGKTRDENRDHPLLSFARPPATVIALFRTGPMFDRGFYDGRYDRFYEFPFVSWG